MNTTHEHEQGGKERNAQPGLGGEQHARTKHTCFGTITRTHTRTHKRTHTHRGSY